MVEYPHAHLIPGTNTFIVSRTMTTSPLAIDYQPIIEQLLRQVLPAERNVVVLVVSEDNRVLDYALRPISDVITLLDASGFGHPVAEDAGILHQIMP